MSGWILLSLALFGALLVANSARPTRGPWTLMPSWIGVFLTTDLVFHHIALQIIVVSVSAGFGALESMPGKVAMFVMVLSSLVLLRVWWPARRSEEIVDKAAADLGLEDLPPPPGSLLFSPFKRRREGVQVLHNIEFYDPPSGPLRLDVYQPDLDSDDRPALIYLHGGGWVFGDKRDQGLPLCNHMASLGWVCFNINYRLSPGATWPEHLIDAKAAIAWVREHAGQFGVDPAFVAMSGGSAGAQIAAMAALTPDRDDLQPGFEDADTTLQAVVTSYGIYDLTNRLGAHNPEFITKMVGPLIIKADPKLSAEKFSAASPRDHTAGADVPWLVIHGTADELAPIVEARDFAAALKAESSAPSALVELPEASHAFDIYYCHRAIAAVDLTARFLVTARSSSKAA